MKVIVLFGIGLKYGLKQIFMFLDRIKPSVQKISITCFVENFME